MGYGTLPNTGGPSLLYLLVGILMTVAGWFLMGTRRVRERFKFNPGRP